MRSRTGSDDGRAPTSLRAQRSPYGSVPDNPKHLSPTRLGLLRRLAPGNNVWAFGHTAGTTGSSSSSYMPSGPHGCAGAWGYRTDGDAGLMHAGARYYDGQVGCFITRDTVLSEHPYLYCEHDPVNAVDPSGNTGVWKFLRLLAISVTHWSDGGEGEPYPIEILPPLPSPKVGPPPPWWNGGRVPLPRGFRIRPGGGPGAGAGGAGGTLIVGAATLYVGSAIVSGYRDRIQSFMDPDGNWATH